MSEGKLHVLIARIPAPGIPAFQDYESRVLPLLAEHGGVLQRRVRTEDGTIEIHFVCFPTSEDFPKYRDDPRRLAHAHLMAESGAVTELFEMYDAG